MLCSKAADRQWIRDVRHAAGLGSPHLGTPLEKLADAGAWRLACVRRNRPFATVLKARSAGIKDLCFRYDALDSVGEPSPAAESRDRLRAAASG